MRRLIITLLISTLIINGPLLFPEALPEAIPSSGPVPLWSAFRGNAQRTGWAAGPAPVHGEELWSLDTGGPVQSSPVLGNGMVYIGSDNGRLYALSPATGEERWNRSFGEFANVQSTPLVSSGVVYVGTQNGSGSGLFALNASDGSLLWSVPDDTGIPASPALHGGTVYSCSQNGSVVAVEAASGRVLWQTRRQGELWSSPAVDGGCVYGATDRGDVFALWSDNGTVRWNLSFPGGWTVYSTPAIMDGTVYFGASAYDREGELLAVNASTGGLIWRFSACEGAYGSPAVTDGALYAHVWNKSAGGSFLVAIPARDPNGDGVISGGELLWSFQTMDFEGGSSPLVTDNLVVVGSSDGNVYAVDRWTGKPVWNASVGGKIVSSPTLYERKVYVGSMSGKVHCLGSSSELPGLRISVRLERESLPAGMVMRINVWVTDEAGNPAEGAFVRFSVTSGNLSQSGASTFPDGSQSIKYLAPPVERDTAVRLSMSAAKGGYSPAAASTDFTVTVYRSAYSGVQSQSTFNFAKYSPYLLAIVALGIADAAVFALLAKKGWLGRRRRKAKGGVRGG